MGRYLTVALRLDTLSSIVLSFAFKRGSLKYPNWEICMLVKLRCEKEKCVFMRAENKGKLPTGRMVEVYLMVSCIWKIGVGSVYIFLQIEKWDLHSLKSYGSQRSWLRMLAISPEVWNCSSDWVTSEKKFSRFCQTSIRDSQSWHQHLDVTDSVLQSSSLQPYGDFSGQSKMDALVKILCCILLRSAAWKLFPCVLNTVWEIGLRIQLAKNLKARHTVLLNA